MKILITLITAAALSGCAYKSPGAKVNTPITVNASLTPAGTQILP